MVSAAGLLKGISLQMEGLVTTPTASGQHLDH
jgi:hypothetical protein